MAVGIVYEMDGMDAKMYDTMNERILAGGYFPAGLVLHAAGGVDGGWRIIELWESMEAFESARAERLDRAAQEAIDALGEVPSGARISTFEVHNLLRG